MPVFLAFVADLSSQAAVTKLATEVLSRHPRIDVLVSNAGAMYTTRQLTVDGIRADLGRQPLGTIPPHWIDPRSAQASGAVRVSSRRLRTPTKAPPSLSTTLAPRRPTVVLPDTSRPSSPNILFTRELARRLEGSGTVCSCFHQVWSPARLQPKQRTIDELGDDPAAAGVAVGGEGCRNAGLADPCLQCRHEWWVLRRHGTSVAEPAGRIGQTAQRLWEISERQCGRHWPELDGVAGSPWRNAAPENCHETRSATSAVGGACRG